MEISNDSRIGIIYKIEGYGLTYIGSTIQPIYERKSTHKTQYNEWVKRDKKGWKCASYDILDKGDNWEIIVIKTILTDINKKGLLDLEQKYINETNNINKNQALQSQEDLKEYKRKWAEKNRREKGIEEKKKLTTEEKRAYQAEWMKEKRLNRTQEQIEEENKKRRETRKPLTEEQKEQARERARKQREDKKKTKSS
jgi:hypothetical protein